MHITLVDVIVGGIKKIYTDTFYFQAFLKLYTEKYINYKCTAK